MRTEIRRRRRGAVILFSAMALLMALVGPAAAGPKPQGSLTSDASYLDLAPGLPSGAKVLPILSVGDVVDGVKFEGIPDGLGLKPGPDRHTVEVFVAHEQTTIPFFGTNDFQDASVTSWVLSTKSGPGRLASVLSAEEPLGPETGFKRFCSASMAGPAEGFSDYTFLVNEESNDKGLSVPAGAPYGPDVFPGDGTRQGGYGVVLNTDTGDFTQVDGMGRLNHENTIALPGFDQLTLLTTDDTFNRPSAQVYMYLADDQDALFDDEGTLWAFRVTGKNGVPVDPSEPFNGANDYNDVQEGDDLTGEFIRVPDNVADGATADYPQDALEDWSNDNNVFQFVRAEDIAYDKNNPRVVYMADTGGSQVQPDPTTGRLFRDRSSSSSVSPGGAVFRFEFSDDDAKVVDSFTKLAQGDDDTQGNFVPMVSPDNLDTSKKSLMAQEDNDDAKIWQYRLQQEDWRVVATVNDSDGESSGIVDATEFFGPGNWLLTIQAHGFWVDEEFDEDTGVTTKREDGQLLLIKIPGS
jgi:hypothetical protein